MKSTPKKNNLCTLCGPKKAFTLIELMIVVSILGILAAIVYPEFQNHAKKAKETQAKANLKLLRDAIERYAAEHGGIPPGYPNNDTSQTPSAVLFVAQIAQKATNSQGEIANIGTPGYNFGPYISSIPVNPFNHRITIAILDASSEFIPLAEVFGWLYKPATKEIRLNSPDADSQGINFIDY